MNWKSVVFSITMAVLLIYASVSLSLTLAPIFQLLSETSNINKQLIQANNNIASQIVTLTNKVKELETANKEKK